MSVPANSDSFGLNPDVIAALLKHHDLANYVVDQVSAHCTRTQSQSDDDVDVYTGKQLAAACDRYNLPDEVCTGVWELIKDDQMVAYGFNQAASLDEQDHLNLVRWTEQRSAPN